MYDIIYSINLFIFPSVFFTMVKGSILINFKKLFKYYLLII